MGTMASQITSLTIVYSAVYSGTDQRKHQSSASLAFVWGIHRWPVNSPHKGPVTRKIIPFDDVIMTQWHDPYIYSVASIFSVYLFLPYTGLVLIYVSVIVRYEHVFILTYKYILYTWGNFTGGDKLNNWKIRARISYDINRQQKFSDNYVIKRGHMPRIKLIWMFSPLCHNGKLYSPLKHVMLQVAFSSWFPVSQRKMIFLLIITMTS